jgi:hypothetical protein
MSSKPAAASISQRLIPIPGYNHLSARLTITAYPQGTNHGAQDKAYVLLLKSFAVDWQ